jgi:hypothetical protein
MDENTAPNNAVRKPVAPAGAEQSSDKDLSQEIERFVDREPQDLVRCARVFGNYYRCNWWSRAGGAQKRLEYNWADVIMDVVRKSCFLSATMSAGKLVMKEIGGADPCRKNLTGEAGVEK